MGKSPSLIRINFHLPTSLGERFTNAAQIQGLTKAKLLRKWIGLAPGQVELARYVHRSSALAQSLVSIRKGQAVSFNMRMDQSSVQLLDSMSKGVDVGRSQLLRALIDWGLEQPTDTKEQALESRLVDKLTSSSQESEWQLMSPIALITKSMQLVDSGNLYAAASILDLLEGRSRSGYREGELFAYIDSVRGLIFRHKRDISAAKRTLHSARELADASGSKARNYIYDQLSVLAELEEDTTSSLSYYLQNMQTEPTRLSMRLASLYAQQGKTDLAMQQLLLCEGIRLSHPNQHYTLLDRLKIVNRRTVVFLRLGMYAQAQKELKQAAALAKIAESTKEERYYLENSALLCILGQDYYRAQQLLSRATDLELKFRSSNPQLSKATVLLHFTYVALGSSEYIHQIRDIVNLQHRPIFKWWGRLYLYSAEYLFGTPAQTSLGNRDLQQIQLSASVPEYLKLAAGRVLSLQLPPATI